MKRNNVFLLKRNLEIMINDLNKEQEILANFMSLISERCYRAGWMKGLEYALWNAVLHGERNYGHDSITLKDIENLKLLSSKAKSWIYFNDDFEESAIDLNSWKEKFNTEKMKFPETKRF